MYKFTNIKSEVNNVEINLRHESESLTNEFGIDVLYVRNCKFVRCKCFNSLNATGDPNCKLCFGTGHFNSIEKIKVIESTFKAYSFDSTISQLPIGVTNQSNEVYYIRHPFIPKERDYILKVTWDKQGYPVDVLEALEIINIYEMRGDNGRVELNGCLIDNRTDQVRQFKKILSSLPKKIISPLLKGGKTIWPSKIINS